MERQPTIFRIIVCLLVLNLALSGGIIGYIVKSGGETATEPAETTQTTETDGALAFETAENGSYVLYIGLNDKDTYTQLIPTDEAIDTVNEIVSRHVDGYTMQNAEGGWVDETGALTQESSLVYTINGASEEQIIAIMDEVLAALNQNSILVESETVTSCYYSGGDTPS